jgi:hypothetical protein
MKQIRSDDLPQGLKAGLAALLAAMKAKYGEHAVCVGVHIENLANLVGVLGRETLTDEERAQVRNHAGTVCNDVLQDLGRALNVDPQHAFAVARSLQEYGQHAEVELCGEENIPAPVADAALAAIRKAQGKAAA